METEKQVEEILTLTEIALEERPSHLGGEARVVIESDIRCHNSCDVNNWVVQVTYPVRCKTLHKQATFSTLVHARAAGKTLAEALENLAEKCGEKAIKEGKCLPWTPPDPIGVNPLNS